MSDIVDPEPFQPGVAQGTDFVVEHTVPRESREKFLEIENRLDDAVKAAPGCTHVNLEELPSEDPDVLRYRTTISFDNQDQLVAWVDSDLRHDLVHKAREVFHYGYALKVGSKSFAAWFPAPKSDSPPPAAWKMNLLVLVTLYPTVLALGPLLAPINQRLGLGFPAAMLLGNTCSVWITGSFLIPLANKAYEKWLHGRPSPTVNVLAPLSAFGILFLSWLIGSTLSK